MEIKKEKKENEKRKTVEVKDDDEDTEPVFQVLSFVNENSMRIEKLEKTVDQIMNNQLDKEKKETHAEKATQEKSVFQDQIQIAFLEIDNLKNIIKQLENDAEDEKNEKRAMACMAEQEKTILEDQVEKVSTDLKKEVKLLQEDGEKEKVSMKAFENQIRKNISDIEDLKRCLKAVENNAEKKTSSGEEERVENKASTKQAEPEFLEEKASTETDALKKTIQLLKAKAEIEKAEKIDLEEEKRVLEDQKQKGTLRDEKSSKEVQALKKIIKKLENRLENEKTDKKDMFSRNEEEKTVLKDQIEEASTEKEDLKRSMEQLRDKVKEGEQEQTQEHDDKLLLQSSHTPQKFCGSTEFCGFWVYHTEFPQNFCGYFPDPDILCFFLFFCENPQKIHRMITHSVDGIPQPTENPQNIHPSGG